MTNRIFTLTCLALLLTFILASPAQAYLDPGSGSFLLQIILAGIMGFIFMAKIYWKKILAFFGKETPQDPDENE